MVTTMSQAEDPERRSTTDWVEKRSVYILLDARIVQDVVSRQPSFSKISREPRRAHDPLVLRDPRIWPAGDRRIRNPQS